MSTTSITSATTTGADVVRLGGATPPRRLLVAFDFDDRGIRAVRWARERAERLGSQLVVVVPARNPSAEHSPDDEAAWEATMRADTASWLANDDVAIDERSVVVVDAVHDEAILSTARDGDVVVIGAEAHQGVTRWALGSHAHDLAHRLDHPLVLVPPTSDGPSTGPVLLALDGDRTTHAVVTWARALAGPDGALEAVHAHESLYDTFDNGGDHGRREREAIGRADDLGIALHTRGGSADGVLRDVAHERGASLIVLGAREHRSFGGFLLGDVVDHLMHTPPGPLMIVNHHASMLEERSLHPASGGDAA